jgi:hypothetical protein
MKDASMSAKLACSKSIRSCLKAGVVVLSVFLGGLSPVYSQPVAWPVGVLRPPGTDVPASVLGAVALSGDLAVTGYSGNASNGFRVYSRSRVANAWAPSQLLVQGQDPADSAVSLSADPQRLAVGSPMTAGAGKVMIYVHGAGPSGWTLEQTLDAPAGAIQFGKTVSLRGNLLVVTSTQSYGAVYSYRFVPDTGGWVDAGFTFENVSIGSVSAVSDGERIAYCRPLGFAGCATAIYSDSNGWQTEAYPQPGDSGSGRVVGVNSNWMFVRSGNLITAYAHVGAEWQPRQQISSDGGFSMSADGAAIVATQAYASQILKLSAGGVWESVLDVPLGVSSTAIDGGLALIGSQSFLDDGVTWNASGDAAGLFSLSGTYFGGSIQKVNNELWVGASGYASNDQQAGSVWIYPMLGAGAQPQTPSLIPAPPALQRHFGEGIETDGARVAVYSTGAPGPTNGHGTIWLYDAASHLELQQIDLPDPAGAVTKLSLAISGNVLAVSRVVSCASGCASHVLIYRDGGSGFALAQTLPVPAGAPANAYFANSTKLQDDWLLSGKLEFHSSAGTDYQYVGVLSRPSGVSWRSDGVEIDGNHLAVAISPNASRILLVYDFDNTTGWTYSGAVAPGAFTVQNGCLRFAIHGSRIVCTDGSTQSTELYLAVPDGVGSDWTVIGSAPIPEAAQYTNGYGYYQLGWVNDQILIGTPGTSEELAGTAIGRVTIMTLDEAIFGSGFD